MKLDPDLQAVNDKVARLSGLEDKAAFSPQEHALLEAALKRSQRERSDGAPPVSRFREELDFFVICLGYVLVAFAALVMMRWSIEAPLGGAGAFGLAFLAGASGAVFRSFYARPPSTHARGAVLLVAGLVLVVSLIALTAAHAIGSVLGLVLGAVFVRSTQRRRLRAPATDGTRAGIRDAG